MSEERWVLFLARGFKGNEAFREARRLGHVPLLMTKSDLLGAPWDRDALDDVVAVDSLEERGVVEPVVYFLARTRRFVRVGAIDDMNVGIAAALREQLCLPGQGVSEARFFRDKLAMRRRAHEKGVLVPAFTATFHDDDVRAFLRETPGPYLVKPRSEASSRGIRKVSTAEQVYALLDELGDARALHLIERYVHGSVFHVDAATHGGKVRFAEASGYHRPLLDVASSGGMMVTRTVAHGTKARADLLEANERVLAALGFDHGVSHTEFIVGNGGEVYFLESGGRVAGAHIPELVEAATGVSLWREYARLELLEPGAPYEPPPRRDDHAALLIALSRSPWPNLSALNGPEVVWRLDEIEHQAGVVIKTATAAELDALLPSRAERFADIVTRG